MFALVGSDRKLLLSEDAVIDDRLISFIGGGLVFAAMGQSVNDSGEVVLPVLFTDENGGYDGIVKLSLDESFGEATPADLIALLIGYVDDVNANNGIKNSLDAKLETALDAFFAETDDQPRKAVRILEAFIHQVEAQRGRQISDAEARLLRFWADWTIYVLQR